MCCFCSWSHIIELHWAARQLPTKLSPHKHWATNIATDQPWLCQYLPTKNNSCSQHFSLEKSEMNDFKAQVIPGYQQWLQWCTDTDTDWHGLTTNNVVLDTPHLHSQSVVLLDIFLCNLFVSTLILAIIPALLHSLLPSTTLLTTHCGCDLCSSLSLHDVAANNTREVSERHWSTDNFPCLIFKQ